jgi:hypothetical protein
MSASDGLTDASLAGPSWTGNAVEAELGLAVAATKPQLNRPSALWIGGSTSPWDGGLRRWDLLPRHP